MTYEELIKYELEHFCKEKRYIEEKIKQLENYEKKYELLSCRQSLKMIKEIIEIKEERLKKIHSK